VRTFSSNTFKPRRRRISAGRQLTFEAGIRKWGLDETGEELDLEEIFGRRAELVLEIGSGDGRATLEMIRTRPDQDLIAIDVHTPGIARLLEGIDAEAMTNLRVVHGDAMEFLTRCPDGIFSQVRVFFPDPWPKRKQQHRRLFAGGRLDEILRVIALGGSLHVATDIAGYAQWLQGLCGANQNLEGGSIPRDRERPMTRFEELGLSAGRNIHEMLYLRRH
jgi:tRNA (guanine-N7-)-methyltransferase